MKISEVLLTACDKPSLLNKDDISSIVNILVVNSNKLNSCASKHNALVKQVRELQNAK